MCHHVHEAPHETWLRERESETDEDADEGTPSFAQDERDVDVDLLEADDD